MRGEFQIRRAIAADVREIASIHVAATRSAYRGIYSDAYLAGLTVEERIRAWTAEGKGHLAAGASATAVFVAVARAGGRIVGFADVGPASDRFPREAELHAIYLDPAQVGKGIGRALWRACARYAKARGMSAMVADVLSRNAPARAFYARLGARALDAGERTIETGGTLERVVTYRWPAL
jgi:ribosomal protein S18 acetylase RimI-like enzyme